MSQMSVGSSHRRNFARYTKIGGTRTAEDLCHMRQAESFPLSEMWITSQDDKNERIILFLNIAKEGR